MVDTSSIDKMIDAVLNIQIMQMVISSLQHAFQPPSAGDMFSGMFQALFQMMMPIMMISMLTKVFEKLG